MLSTNETANDAASDASENTRVYTFYSFKGGVGRSMALANVGELLYRRGLRVLMIDFDLEAPGLERYFDVPEAVTNTDDVLDRRGLMDLLVSYKSLRSLPQPKNENLPPLPPPPLSPVKDFVASNDGNANTIGCMNITESSFYLTGDSIAPVPQPPASDTAPKQNDDFHFPYPIEPLANFIVPIYAESTNGGMLSLITAGRRLGEEFANYAKNVRTFGWDEFFNNWSGELFFEWFRREAKRYADIVLVDSRTGVTEMSGICSYQLADTVVLFVAPNYQNLDGSRRIARSLSNPDLIKIGRGGRPLWMLFVPSRVESGEGDKLDEFKARFTRELGELFPRHVTFKKDPFIDLRVPYVPYYAYTEGVAVRDSMHAKAADIAAAIEKLVETLAQLEPPGSKLRRLYELSDDERIGFTVEEAFAYFTPDDQRIVRRVLTRLVQVGSPEEGGTHTTFLRVSLQSFNREEQAVIERMAEQRLLTLERETATRSGDTIVRVTDENSILTWKRFQEWLEEDGEFLVWRQQTKANFEQWRTNGRDASFLLYGKALELATSWQERRGAELIESEILFVSESILHDQRQKNLEIERAKQLESIAYSAQQQYQSVQQKQQRRTYIGAGLIVALVFLFMLVAGGALMWRQRSATVASQVAQAEREQLRMRAESYKSDGDNSLQNYDYNAAIDSYSRAIELRPDYVEAYVKRGDIRLQQQMFDEALADYNKAIQLDSNLAEAHYSRGLVHSERAQEGDLDAAIADFSRAIEIKNEYAEAYYQRGAVFGETNRFENAADDYRNAIRYASIPAVQTNAQQALDELIKNRQIASVAAAAVPMPTPTPPRILLHYNNPADLDTTRWVAKNIANKFSDVRGVQLRSEATNGDVRYFYPEDADNAAATRDIVRRSLAARGSKLNIELRFLGGLYRNVPRGQIEVWVPSLQSDAGDTTNSPARRPRASLQKNSDATIQTAPSSNIKKSPKMPSSSSAAKGYNQAEQKKQ